MKQINKTRIKNCILWLYLIIPIITYILSLYYSITRFIYYYENASMEINLRGLLDTFIIVCTWCISIVLIYNILKYLWYFIIAIFYWAIEVDNEDKSLIGYWDMVINERNR